jgi:hypothetical protein
MMAVPCVVLWIVVQPLGGVNAPVPLAVSVATMTCPEATPAGFVSARLVAPPPLVPLLLAATYVIVAPAPAGIAARTSPSRPTATALRRRGLICSGDVTPATAPPP